MTDLSTVSPTVANPSLSYSEPFFPCPLILIFIDPMAFLSHEISLNLYFNTSANSRIFVSISSLINSYPPVKHKKFSYVIHCHITNFKI